jgi:hypothetical protein
MRICPVCDAACAVNAECCPECGHVFLKPESVREAPATVDGDLVELPAARLAAVTAMSYGQIRHSRLSEAELRAYARSRGYKTGWVWYRLREQAGASP